MIPYKYFRLYVTANIGPTQQYTTIYELEMRSAIGGASVCSGGTPTADSTYAGDNVTAVFDGNSATKHSSTSAAPPHWVKYEFAARTDILEYSVQVGTDGSGDYQRPKDWKFQGSNDNVDWDTLDTQSGTTWSSAEEKVFTLATHVVSGEVYEEGSPVEREVHAYRRDTGELVGSGSSDPADGTFDLYIAYAGDVYVVALDDASGDDYNALIYDSVTPVAL